MIHKILFALVFCVFSGSLSAILADTMEPSLGVAFPMQAHEQSVVTTQSVILNKQVVLPAGTVLRCCFQMPEKDSSDLKKKEKKDQIENTFSRKPIKVSSKPETYDPYIEAVKDRAFKTVWTNPDLFRGYFYKIEPTRYYLVYQTGAGATPTFAQFFFPEGLFLGSDGTHLKVLSVESDSRGQQAGFQAGDEIHSMEDIEFGGDLEHFLKRYLTIIKKNKLESRGIKFTISNAEHPEPFERTIQLPLSIHTDPFGPIAE